MAKNISLSLGNYFEQFINEEIQSGRYASASEVVQSALKLLENEERKERKEEELIKALQKGEESGFVEDFDPKQNLTDLHHNHL